MLEPKAVSVQPLKTETEAGTEGTAEPGPGLLALKLIGGEGTVVVAEDEALEPLGAAGIVEIPEPTEGTAEPGPGLLALKLIGGE